MPSSPNSSQVILLQAVDGQVSLDVSLSFAWCFADEASEAAWVILSGIQAATRPEAVPLLPQVDQQVEVLFADEAEGFPEGVDDIPPLSDSPFALPTDTRRRAWRDGRLDRLSAGSGRRWR